MSWTIPNLLLHDKPLALSDQRASGYAHVFAYCFNPGCHHNAVLDMNHLPDETTYKIFFQTCVGEFKQCD